MNVQTMLAITCPVILLLLGVHLSWAPGLSISLNGFASAYQLRTTVDSPDEQRAADAGGVNETGNSTAVRASIAFESEVHAERNETAAVVQIAHDPVASAIAHAEPEATTSTTAPSPRPSACVNLLHWNILDGAVGRLPLPPGGGKQGGSAQPKRQKRLDGIKAFIAARRHDVVTFNELNGIHADDLQALGEEVGLAHTRLLSKSSYRIGIISRAPFDVVLEERGKAFTHGLLCVRLRASGLEVCVTHLNPQSSHKRALEARVIASHVAGREGPVVVVGDLNTLSPLDARFHREDDIATQIGHGPRSDQLSRKFLHPGRTGAAAQIDYRPMQVLLDVPLVDVGSRTEARAYTVPTRVNADQMHFSRLRLDFCLVNAQLAAACRFADSEGARKPAASDGCACSARVLRTEVTEQLSDHFPLDIRLHVPARPAGS
jgi:endonuclease/exonuclease/phosphatase family metal-dependent hydrolase